MLSYVIRRLLWSIPVLIFVSMLTFALMHAVPGGPFSGPETHFPPQLVKTLESYYHLDQPLWKQYLVYIWNLLHGDMGPSYLSSRTVTQIIADHFPVSFQLGLLALGVAMVIGVPLGIFSAIRQNSIVDYSSTLFSVAGVSIPALTLGPLLIWIFALKLHILPVARWGTWQQAILPAFTLGLGSAAILARLTRASMLQVLKEDFIRTARAKGVNEPNVIIRHALKNAILPVVTVLGPLFAGLVTGSLVVEGIFAIPGIGRYFVSSVSSRDYPVIMGTVLLYAVALIVANLVVDIIYFWIDPRIQEGQ